MNQLTEYNSDSENDDNGNNQLNDKLQEFLTDLNTIITTNWTQCIDQSTGHPYYWNTLTKDVTWEMPAEYEQFLQQSLQSKNSKHKQENSYTVHYTDEKVPYYVNEFTRQVSWEKPAGFVEPKAKVKESKSKKSKDAERNGRRKKSSKKSTKSTKQYPFDANDDLDHVKIELISSFTTKSDSSSDEETKAKKLKTNFNLVANDYNSDENSDNENKNASERPPIASLPSTNSIDPSAVVKIYSLKTDLPHAKRSPTDEAVTNVVEKPVAVTKSKANTFASIITGGRTSPSEQDSELIELMKLGATDVSPEPVEQTQPSETPTEIDTKSFKRKRRIEFMTRPVAPQIKPSTEATSEDGISSSVGPVNELDAQPADGVKTTEESSAKPMYSNFVRGTVEVPDTVNESSKSEKVPDAVIVADESSKCKEEIGELRTIIESKLKFLCNGRPDVSAVQAIFIQFETLIEAYENQALQPAYMQRWLSGISSDLSTLENDAAPAGWKCLWNRKKSQYCYKNLSNGDIRWEYPDSDKSDEMDICTTPPPNVDEQLKLEQTVDGPKINSLNGDDNSMPQHDENGMLIPPPPPCISFVHNEPPPPGTGFDITNDKPSENISSELASFYSEMASIDTNSMPATEPQLPASSSSTDNTATVPTNDSADAALKKKKKKVKKSEPWRSGNLETWINKWQKAQKELDG